MITMCPVFRLCQVEIILFPLPETKPSKCGISAQGMHNMAISCFFRNHMKYTLLFKEAGIFFLKIDAQDILLPFWVEPSFCSLFSSLLFLLLVSQ